MQQTFVRRHYRTVFLSDLHLGLRASRADLLLDFLGGMDCGRIVLVGDIVDGWRLRKSWYWDAHHDEVIRLL
ncbi:UDP-2,3-diacylglucosamine diphosphatase, partial [Roseomonas mucosa]